MSVLTPPGDLLPLLRRLEELASERGTCAYLVGGSVRDLLLGRPLRDLDIAVESGALALARHVADALQGHFVELDDVHSIARVVLDEYLVSYIDVAQLQGSLEEDLRRRDFTVDALGAPLTGGDIVDVCGGLPDLDARRLRMTSQAALDSDPLRLLRGARVASEIGLELDAGTLEAIRRRAPRVLEAAAERRRDELSRILALPHAAEGIRRLDDLRLLEALMPEVTAGRGVLQPKEHAYDVLEHGIRAVEAMDRMLAGSRPETDGAWMWESLWRIFAWRGSELRRYVDEVTSEGRTRGSMLKLAALLHDVAKPQTRTVDATGRVRFLGHADEGARIAGEILGRHRYSMREIAFVKVLVREHLRPVQLARVGEAPTMRALYRFHRDLGDALEGVLLLSLADAAAARGERMSRDVWERQAAYMNSMLVRLQGEEGIVRAPRLLTGHDIMSEFGLAEGPRIGRLLEAVREAQALARVSDRAGALAYVRALLDEEEM